MKYLHLLMEAAGEVWLMEKTKLDTILQFMLFKSDGGMLSAGEIEARIGKGKERQVARADGNIGVLPIHGVMMQHLDMISEQSGGQSTNNIAANFRSLLADPEVKAIIMDMHTPGGTSFGIEELANEIYDSRGEKPIIAQVDSMAASAGYWLACAADEIVCTPGGQAGSIGVYTIHEDISKMLEAKGIKTTIIKAGENKIAANEYGPLSEAAAAHLQQRVNDTRDRFVKAVARGRNVSMAHVRQKFGDGAVYDSKNLLDRGMVDGIATFEQTLERFGANVNPIASKARSARMARDQASALLAEKLRSGEPISTRVLEQGLEGLLNLTGTEATVAVRGIRTGLAQGELDRELTAPIVGKKDVKEIRHLLSGISSILSK